MPLPPVPSFADFSTALADRRLRVRESQQVAADAAARASQNREDIYASLGGRSDTSIVDLSRGKILALSVAGDDGVVLDFGGYKLGCRTDAQGNIRARFAATYPAAWPRDVDGTPQTLVGPIDVSVAKLHKILAETIIPN